MGNKGYSQATTTTHGTPTVSGYFPPFAVGGGPVAQPNLCVDDLDHKIQSFLLDIDTSPAVGGFLRSTLQRELSVHPLLSYQYDTKSKLVYLQFVGGRILSFPCRWWDSVLELEGIIPTNKQNLLNLRLHIAKPT